MAEARQQAVWLVLLACFYLHDCARTGRFVARALPSNGQSYLHVGLLVTKGSELNFAPSLVIHTLLVANFRNLSIVLRSSALRLRLPQAGDQRHVTGIRTIRHRVSRFLHSSGSSDSGENVQHPCPQQRISGLSSVTHTLVIRP